MSSYSTKEKIVAAVIYNVPNPQFVQVPSASFWNPSKGFGGFNAQQSRFSGKHHNPAISLVVNYILTALDNNQHCVALFIGPSKAFDKVDHSLQLHKIFIIGLK